MIGLYAIAETSGGLLPAGCLMYYERLNALMGKHLDHCIFEILRISCCFALAKRVRKLH